MKTAAQYLKDEYNIEMSKGNIDASWFQKEGLAMIVECKCCTMTMALPSAFVDDDGNIYCASCKGDD